MKQVPSIGRIVHYILSARESATNAGVARPAIITRVSDGGDVGLTVFPDCHHDQASATVYVKSAPYNEDEGNKSGTWRWPPYVAPFKETGDREIAQVVNKPESKAPSFAAPRSFTEADSELTKADSEEPASSDETPFR